MAHFALLDERNVVRKVVVVKNSQLLEGGAESEEKGVAFLKGLYGGGEWKQTSYSASFRKNYAGVGYSYDAGRDAFVPPRPYPSWTLDESTCRWVPPTPVPSEGGPYIWNEVSSSWEIFVPNPSRGMDNP